MMDSPHQTGLVNDRRAARRLGIAALAALLAAGCTHSAPTAKAGKPVEVVVTTPVADRITDYQDFTGRLDAVKTVDIRARVSGYITQVPFKEGDLVKEGDLLFQIDPRTYQADFNQAVANYKLAEADQNLQEKNAVRMKKLVGTGAVTQEEVDQVTGALEKSRAAVGAALAARDHAKLYLDYTRVTAPVSGRISRRFVDPGNLVNADSTLLTTVVAEDPMWAYFDVDERTYLDLVGAASGDQSAWLAGAKYPVWMRLANEADYTHAGVVDFVDNRLNGNTGTIRLRGVFDNPRHMLKSGLFVRIRLPIGQSYSALLIPDEAIQSDQGRKYVYVVNDQNTVEYRTVEPGQAVQGLRVIKKGIGAKDRVIVSGMQRVKPKAEVRATVQEPPKPPSTSGKQLTYDPPANAGHQAAGG
ncbi:MAG TPA: efflux RND transporter periplasmic adaptor subunit [Gemmataceae bacterium]|jgi:RND family efflux transporter MFP subunit